MNLWAIFLTGLTSGGLSCLAMQGGLLTSIIANQKEDEHESLNNDRDLRKKKRREAHVKSLEKKNFSLASFDVLDLVPVLLFLFAKFVSHTLLGFLLGALGATLTLSLNVRLAFQIFTALFMFATAMNLLDVHPIFRYVVISPPNFLQKLVRNQSKSKAYFAPAILGFFTIFVPCGITQAMEVLAINTGSPIQGALIMGTFVLGTSPLFAIIGVATAKLSEGWYKAFTKVAAGVLILMSLYFINGVLIVRGAPSISIPQHLSTETIQVNTNDEYGMSVNTDIQQVTINVVANGYSPNYVKVEKGKPVSLTLQSKDTYTCALSFIFNEFNIRTFLASTDRQTFTFTPTQKGTFPFSCSMGMYRGVMEVI